MRNRKPLVWATGTSQKIDCETIGGACELVLFSVGITFTKEKALGKV